MADNNSVRAGDVSDTGDGINVKDLLHLSDVVDGRTGATGNENLYELDGDSTISQEDADALYDILRGDRSAPDAISKVEFRWIYNEEHGDSFLQIKNWNGYQGLLDSGVVSEYANVYWFYEDTFNALDDNLLELRPSVADNYPFEKNFDIDENTNIEFILKEGVYRLYINGFPVIIYPVEDGNQVKMDDANPPVYTDGETENGYYPLSKKSMTSFISTWEVGADSLEIELPLGDLLSGGHVNQLKIDFGDQTSVVYVNSATSGKISHTYAQAGNYEIKITGKLETWSFNNDEFSSNITNISQWGCLNLTTTTHQFDGCDNLDVGEVPDYPIIDESTSLECCFQNCTSLTGGMESWKVKNVVSFEKMFNGCTNFNGDVSSWDTSSATNMVSMFMNASVFNADVNTKSIGNETAWDVSNVTDANRMFAGCTSFDQSIHEWDVGSMQDMELILNDVTLSLCNYIKIIRKWSTLAFENTNIKFGASLCKYDFPTQSYRSILEQSVSIIDGGLDTENSCDGYVLYATLVTPTLEHINSGVDLMDSRKWQDVWDDTNNQDQYEAIFLPFYDIDYQLSKSLYDAENNKLSDHVSVDNSPYLMFDVTYENPTYNYEHIWSVVVGSTSIANGSSDIPTLQQQFPTATIVDSLIEIDSLNTITTEKIIIPLGNLYVATVEDYISMERPLPTQLPNPGEHLYVYRKDESTDKMVKSETIRADTFDAEYVEANFSTYPRQMCMYVDNGLSGMMVYAVSRPSLENRGNYYQRDDSTIEVNIKENGVWSDARKIEDVIPELKESPNIYSVKQDGRIHYCPNLTKLLLLHHNGYIWLNYDDTSNTLSYHMESDPSGGVDFPASSGSHSHGLIDVTSDMDILYENGIRKFSGSGYSELIRFEYEIPNAGRYQGNGCRKPHIRYNRKNDTIEVTYFTSADNSIPFSGNLVCVKDIYTIDQNIRPKKVSSSTITKQVVDESGQSMYPSLFVNQGEQMEDLHGSIWCIFPTGASDDVNSFYFPLSFYWESGMDRAPLLYHNTETNHVQSFELDCDALLRMWVSHGVLITIEYDADNSGGDLWSADASTNTYVRFTQINTSDPVNIQLSQIGERKNIKDMGFQVPINDLIARNSSPADRVIIYGSGESYGVQGGGDWLSVAPNANKDIFSVLIT